MPGVLELAQYVFQNRVRTAEPNHIGVREPQYTTAVGLIKFACQKAKQQGISIGNSTTTMTEKPEKRIKPEPEPVLVKEKSPKKPNEKGKFKKIIDYFFE